MSVFESLNTVGYTRIADIQLTQGGVFTPAAAMTRLRAQLILQANKRC